MPRVRNWKDLKWFKATPDEIYQHIETLFSKEAIDWALISCHLPDMLQVAQSIRAGRLSPSTILRKLGTASRKNKLYFAFRELGRVIRTLFLLDILAMKNCAVSFRLRKINVKVLTSSLNGFILGPTKSRITYGTNN